jgi:hypothetical protein
MNGRKALAFLSLSLTISTAIGSAKAGRAQSAIMPAPKSVSSRQPKLLQARKFHTATLLANGNVLVFGGWSGNTLAYHAVPDDRQAEVFNPSTGEQWLVPVPMPGRWNHTATALARGEILILGGNIGKGGKNILPALAPRNALIYTYKPKDASDKGHFRVVEKVLLKHSRAGHSATQLADGCVVIVGGGGDTLIDFLGNTKDKTDDCRARHPWQPTHWPRNAHTATIVGDTLVIAGGGSGGPTAQAVDVYNVRTGDHKFMESDVFGAYYHTATRLDNSRILFAGGHTHPTRAVVWVDGAFGKLKKDPEKNINLAIPRDAHLAVALKDSGVALIGGCSGCSSSKEPDWGKGCHVKDDTHRCRIVTPYDGYCTIKCVDICHQDQDGTVSCAVGEIVPFEHYLGAATCLNDGSVLLTGGSGSDYVNDAATDTISVVRFESECRPD